jgi:formate dehydrogenase subunit gamma
MEPTGTPTGAADQAAEGLGGGDAGATARVQAIVARHGVERGPLLPILHDIQAELGAVDGDAVRVVAHELNLARADVHGVVTFYSDFRSTPGGRSTVRICRAEACQSVGADGLVEHARARLGIDLGGTTPDGALTLESVFCLGNCALSPAVMIDDTLVGRVDEGRFDALVEPLLGER